MRKDVFLDREYPLKKSFSILGSSVMASTIFKLISKECLGIFFVSFLVLGICQDRIIISNISLDEDYSNSTTEDSIIPESLLIQLGTVKNVSDLLSRFIAVAQRSPMHGPSVENTTVSERRALAAGSTAAIAQPANCQTEQHIIELDKPENGAMIYWPSCIRVRRCGGCCTSTMLSCKPLATSILNVTVLQMLYNHESPNSFESQGTRIFSLEQHDRCACSCKQVADDCDSDVHEYKPHECRCVCKNAEDAALCTGSKKIWDSRYCVCKCRKIRMCSSGRFFNVLNCRCELLRRSLAVQSLNQQNSTLSTQVASFSP